MMYSMEDQFLREQQNEKIREIPTILMKPYLERVDDSCSKELLYISYRDDMKTYYLNFKDSQFVGDTMGSVFLQFYNNVPNVVGWRGFTRSLFAEYVLSGVIGTIIIFQTPNQKRE